MKYILISLLTQALDTLKSKGVIAPEVIPSEIKVERTKEAIHGDFSSNLAMILAKPCRQAPRVIAKWLIENLPTHPVVDRMEFAEPGFINFFIRQEALTEIVGTVIKEREKFGRSNLGKGQKVIIEFVSANPTGPLHVGHGRSAAFGASLANILTHTGYTVSREYYVNDAGRQMDILAVSVWLRYLSQSGEAISFPTNGYRGEYVFTIGQQLLAKYGTVYVHSWGTISETLPADEPEGGDKERYIDAIIERAKFLLGEVGFNRFHQYALETVLSDIKNDLAEFGVQFDNWFSERTLLNDGSIQKGINALSQAGQVYEKDDALWFRATEFGDEKDRVLIRANGQNTYFAADVAYHWDKYERGFDRIIDIFGADHHGYTARVKAAINALGHDDSTMKMLLVQFAILYRGGERVQMSTRSGSFITLRELRDEVGNDAARFFYIMRKSEQHMDFDLDLAKAQSTENPVFYIQYAHARICSVLRQLKEREMVWDEELGLTNLTLLTLPQEISLIVLLNQYSEILNAAAVNFEPHQLAHYLRDLAHGLHSYYNAVHLLCEQNDLRSSRLCLLKAVGQVLNNGLQILGVSAPESM